MGKKEMKNSTNKTKTAKNTIVDDIGDLEESKATLDSKV